MSKNATGPRPPAGPQTPKPPKPPNLRRLIRTYRLVQADPIGRWLLAVVWSGLGLCTVMAAAYLPILIERREVLAAAGCEVSR
jgi:hypothetical protein